MSRELCVLPCWLLSSILWDSIWRASDRAPCRCVHYLWEEEEQTEFILCLRYVSLWIYRRLRVCVYALRNPPACSKTASEPSHLHFPLCSESLLVSSPRSRVLICGEATPFMSCWSDNSDFLTMKSQRKYRASLEEHVTMMSVVSSHEDSFGFIRGHFVISTAETRSMIWPTHGSWKLNVCFQKQ